MAHLDEHKILSNKQQVFMKWHSCETQLTMAINDWAKILDNKGQVDTFIFDFEKAFDTPPHELLKSKLFSYGTYGTPLLPPGDCFLAIESTLRYILSVHHHTGCSCYNVMYIYHYITDKRHYNMCFKHFGGCS